MYDYNAMTDEEICRCIADGDQGGIDYLLNKYKGVVRKKARSFYLMGGDNDDLIQEGMIGLMKAIWSFDADCKTSFGGFADMCISRQIYSAVKASQRKKHLPLNSYISLYEAPEDEDAPALLDTLTQSVAGPEEAFFDKEQAAELWLSLYESLSTMERDVLNLYMGGLEYTQIAKRLQKKEKAVDNALQRIKAKAAKLYGKGY